MKRKESIFYIIIRPVITVLFKMLYRPKIMGEDFIPKSGGIILAGNHTNNYDCLLLMSSTKRPIHFLAKAELWKGFKKIIFNNLGLIPVNRKVKDPNVLVSAYEYLNSNKVIGIFPEGTFSYKNGELRPFKIGAVKMSYETNCPIIPFYISGSYKLFSKDLMIVFGKPINIKSNNLVEENDKLRNKIISMGGK